MCSWRYNQSDECNPARQIGRMQVGPESRVSDLESINSRTHCAHAALIFIERAVAKAKRNGLEGWEGLPRQRFLFVLHVGPHGMGGPCGRWWSQLVLLGPTLRHQSPALIRCFLVFGSRPFDGWSIKLFFGPKFNSLQSDYDEEWMWNLKNGKQIFD